MESNIKRIILASASPRRRELVGGLDIPFDVHVLPDVDESYPDSLPLLDVSEYIAVEKSRAYDASKLKDGEVLLTADTTVVCGDEIMGKPVDEQDARRMLHELSGRTHKVVTGVCLTMQNKQRHFSVVTEVTFAELDDEEIDYYVGKYKPLDKAGAYGIQEWIGYIGCAGINGSYYNVMGLPVQRVYSELKKM